MGVFQDLLDNAITFQTSDQIGAWLSSKIASQVDPEANAAAAETDAVHTLAESTQTSGGADLTFTLRNGETFDVAITFEDAAATVETAIDVAATAASITGWTNGDISVSGTAVDDGGLVFTFDGDSVSGINHPVTTLADDDGAGGAWGALTLTTAGQSARYALDVLIALGALDDGTIAAQTDTASNSGFALGVNSGKVPGWVIYALAREAAAEDANNDTYHTIVEVFPFDDRARKAQYLGGSSVV